MDALKSKNITVYNNTMAIDSLNHARSFFLTLGETDHGLNQLCNGLMKLKSNVSKIYSYMEVLSNKNLTPTLIVPVDLKNI